MEVHYNNRGAYLLFLYRIIKNSSRTKKAYVLDIVCGVREEFIVLLLPALQIGPVLLAYVSRVLTALYVQYNTNLILKLFLELLFLVACFFLQYEIGRYPIKLGRYIFLV